MKKRIFTTISVLLFLCSLSSCTRNRNEDVYFVHAICFDETEGGMKILTVSEKQSGDEKQGDDENTPFIILEAEGKNLQKAIGVFRNKYENVYFATGEIYIFKENCDRDFLIEVSQKLCDSAVFPTKSLTILADTENTKEFLSEIKKPSDIKRILHLTGKSKTNIISFLAKVNEGKMCSVPLLTLSEDGRIEFIENTIFKNEDTNEKQD